MITKPERSFDDFANSGADQNTNNKILGLK